MYVLPVPLIPRNRTLRGMGQMTSMPGVSKAWCDARGGSYDHTTAPYGMPYGSGGSCHYMEAAPAPSMVSVPQGTGTRVSVPTTTQIQVSPQISPVFVQQFQPTGSPVGAGTAMTGAPAASQSDPAMLRYLELQAEREAAESERQAMLMERLLAPREAPPPQPQFFPMGAPGEPEPEISGEPTPSSSGGAAPGLPGFFATLGRGGSILPLLAAAAIIGVVAMGGKGKPGAKRGRKAKRK